MEIKNYECQETETLHVTIFRDNMLGYKISAFSDKGWQRYCEIHLNCERSMLSALGVSKMIKNSHSQIPPDFH